MLKKSLKLLLVCKEVIKLLVELAKIIIEIVSIISTN